LKTQSLWEVEILLLAWEEALTLIGGILCIFEPGEALTMAETEWPNGNWLAEYGQRADDASKEGMTEERAFLAVWITLKKADVAYAPGSLWSIAIPSWR